MRRKHKEQKKVIDVFSDNLVGISFDSLTRKDLHNIPEFLLSNLFESWFLKRIKKSGAELDSIETNALKNAILSAIVCKNGYAYAIELDEPNKKLRFMLHSASNWMGLVSYTENQTVYVNIPPNKSSLDDIAFESYNEALSRGAKVVHPHHIKNSYPVSSRPSFIHYCNSCSVRRDVEQLYISVYHYGIFCETCLKSGQCETDPDNCSKWEEIDCLL